MPIFRNTIRKSRRERLRRIDRMFERAGQVILVAYFLFVFVAWLSYRETFHISEVQIEGAQAVDAALVQHVVESQLARRLLWKIDRNNIVFYPRWTLHSSILVLDPRVKDLDLDVKGKQLAVRLREYSPAFLWCPPQGVSTTTDIIIGCSFADETGHIFAPAPEYSGDPFLIFMTTTVPERGRFLLSRDEFDKVQVFLGELKPLLLAPRIVRESGAHDFTITTGESWEIRWSSERDPEEDARNLALVLQNLSGDHMGTSTLKSVDLRFGNKVFYR